VDQESITNEIERFVRSVRDEEADLDRVLATVVFTDIVGSTQKAVELGDRDCVRSWSDITRRSAA
jgi:class 3 adenylate cyclase